MKNNENQAKSRKFKENHGLAAKKIMKKYSGPKKSINGFFYV